MIAPTLDPRCAILYVDDEETALKYFRKGFSREFRIFTASSVAQAIEILEKEHAEIGVLVTDQRMPNQTGVHLLNRVRSSWPNIVRIMLTAYSDMTSAVEAVNLGAVYKYLTKPIDFAQLRIVLHDAINLHVKTLEQEAVVQEKMDTLQRMVVADRVKSLSSMASGLSHHLRNSMTAISCYFEMFDAMAKGDAKVPEELQEMFALANQERGRLLRMMQEITDHTSERKLSFAENADLGDLIRQAAAAVSTEMSARKLVVELPAALPRVKLDSEAILRTLGAMIGRVCQYTPEDAPIRIAAAGPAAHWNTKGVRITVSGQGVVWSNDEVASFFTPVAISSKSPSALSLDLLDAFFTASGHGGDLLAHPEPPAGPGFELQLPLDPAAVHRAELTPGPRGLPIPSATAAPWAPCTMAG